VSAPRGLAAVPASQRVLIAGIGGLTRWSKVNSPEERRDATAPARRGLEAKWAREADPEGVLPPDELEAAVARLRKAHYLAMSLKSAQTRSGSSGRRPAPEAGGRGAAA